MSYQRDLAWEYLEQVNKSSISYQLARYGLALDYSHLPPNVLRAAKRSLLDTLGCAIGAYDAPGRPMLETAMRRLGGTEEATVFGSGLRTSAANATLVNCFLVRFLDFNDLGGGGHNSDAIPGILAVAEREKASGKDVLTAIVASYELGARFTAASGIQGGQGGWNFDLRGGLTMPPVLGKMMGMSEEQIANAIGITTCHCLPLGILDTNLEENTMSKNLRFGFVAHDAIIACLMAKEGFTGPVRIVEGENGLNSAVLGGVFDREKMLDFSGWRILNTRHKLLCLNISTIGHVAATLAIVNEHKLKPEDIASVRIKATLHESHHTTVLSKKYPRNAETADHSAFYANAIAIKEGRVSPDIFEPEKFTDPVVLDLIEKITVEHDPTLTGFGGASVITTRDGRTFEKRIDTPHGLGNDPFTDKEIEDKFSKMAFRYMGGKQVKQIIATVWSLEKLNSISRLTKLMVFPGK
ncbi:MAG: MmgE/PrpD family protein [Chloroflexota bacterium]